jgi:hypothetical protein
MVNLHTVKYQYIAFLNLQLAALSFRKRVMVLTSADEFGTGFRRAFADYSSSKGISTIYSAQFTTGDVSLATVEDLDIISTATSSDCRVFVMCLPAGDAGTLMELLYDAGVLTVGTQVVGCSTLTTPLTLAAISTVAKRTAIMTGYIGVAPYKDFSTTAGAAFLSQYKAFVGSLKPNSTLCLKQDDDVGSYLFQQSGQSPCSNISSLAKASRRIVATDGSNLDPLLPYVYDTVYAAARTLHTMIYTQGQKTINGNIFLKTLVQNVTFAGASGTVGVSSASITDSTHYMEGDRLLADTTLGYYNFQPSLYLTSVTNPTVTATAISALATVGKWTYAGGVQLCPATGTAIKCPIVYNTVRTSIPPLDRQATVYLKLPKAYQGLLIAMVAIQGSLVLFFALVVLRFGRKRLVRALYVPALWVMLLAGALATVEVALQTQTPSDPVCLAQYWFSNLPFIAVIVIFLKALRLHLIVNVGSSSVGASAGRRVVTMLYMMIGIISSVLFLLIYLSVVSGVSRPRKVHTFSESPITGAITVDTLCYQPTSVLTYILNSFEMLLMIVAARLCYSLKDVPDATREMKKLEGG